LCSKYCDFALVLVQIWWLCLSCVPNIWILF
jgi:hypothetical protein